MCGTQCKECQQTQLDVSLTFRRLFDDNQYVSRNHVLSVFVFVSCLSAERKQGEIKPRAGRQGMKTIQPFPFVLD
jgi:hypothetical protein